MKSCLFLTKLMGLLIEISQKEKERKNRSLPGHLTHILKKLSKSIGKIQWKSLISDPRIEVMMIWDMGFTQRMLMVSGKGMLPHWL